jgi:predicted lipid-binding transport protein (Tim44 family)
MNQSFDVSTIIFAALAIFIVWKLRSVLGTRTGEERPPTNPFARRSQTKSGEPGQPSPEMGKIIPLPGAAPANATGSDDPNRWKGVVEPGSQAEAGLDRIAAADPSFSGKGFIGGARMAYEMIVSAFARGDTAALSGLLAKDVYDGFVTAIAERESRGERVEHTFVVLDKAEIEDAQLRDRTAQITVRFESEQINATKTKSGELAEGSSEAVGQVIDHWTFARDISARDPNWTLVATNAE